jgi:hypothetical protein
MPTQLSVAIYLFNLSMNSFSIAIRQPGMLGAPLMRGCIKTNFDGGNNW